MSHDIESVYDKLNDLDTRTAIIEADFQRVRGMRKILLGLSAGFLLQVIVGAVGYGRLVEAVDASDHVDSLDYHLENHPDQSNNFDRRLTRLETLMEIVIQQQSRLLSILDSRIGSSSKDTGKESDG